MSYPGDNHEYEDHAEAEASWFDRARRAEKSLKSLQEVVVEFLQVYGDRFATHTDVFRARRRVEEAL